MKPLLLLSTALAGFSIRAGDFVNLDFDNPDLSRLTTNPSLPKFGPVEDLLRGWTVSLRYDLQNWEPYTGEVEFGTIAIFKPVALISGLAIGRYGLWISSPPETQPNQPRPPEIRVSTTGTVPLNAESFEWAPFGGTVSLEVGGELWGDFPGLQSSLDVRRFAGQEVTLGFTVASRGQSALDVIGFKTVPEPQTWALLGVGLGVLLWFSRKR